MVTNNWTTTDTVDRLHGFWHKYIADEDASATNIINDTRGWIYSIVFLGAIFLSVTVAVLLVEFVSSLYVTCRARRQLQQNSSPSRGQQQQQEQKRASTLQVDSVEVLTTSGVAFDRISQHDIGVPEATSSNGEGENKNQSPRPWCCNVLCLFFAVAALVLLGKPTADIQSKKKKNFF